MSKCFRANGVSNFPDASAGPGGGVGFSGILVTDNGGLVVDGITFAGPAFRSAERKCREFLSPSGPPPRITESQKLKMLAFAHCMRAHGAPQFPDPTFQAGPGKALPPGLNPQSPSFRQAAAACGKGSILIAP
jgi:hypothetical protein